MVLNKLGDTKVLVPIIFSDKLVHADVYAQLKTIMPGWRPGYGVKCVSAGKIEHIEVGGLGGNSTTLKLASGEGDQRVIENYSYEHGIL